MTRDPWGEIDDALRGDDPPAAPGEREHGLVYSALGCALAASFGALLAVVVYFALR